MALKVPKLKGVRVKGGVKDVAKDIKITRKPRKGIPMIPAGQLKR
ncbi:hypothetical protein UFOVP9_52 [uncultured Caudovirales phage]|jgi:CRISPR/Cas system CSM-associated protein Csm3 (group 7 of RAMP superfamily)|uniref:Uncharacterized protein n=1 Tax=uncultured Caudovirales phage TaxID=2100421 RepID=A0A6J5KK45_9CAUD|nr:hypothetical protein UFOVP9_52 [uncultured Caudovirales phage]